MGGGAQTLDTDLIVLQYLHARGLGNVQNAFERCVGRLGEPGGTAHPPPAPPPAAASPAGGRRPD